MEEADLYGDLITSRGDAGDGLLKGQVRFLKDTRSASFHTCWILCHPQLSASWLAQVAELQERTAAQGAQIVGLTRQVEQLTKEVRASRCCGRLATDHLIKVSLAASKSELLYRVCGGCLPIRTAD